MKKTLLSLLIVGLLSVLLCACGQTAHEHVWNEENRVDPSCSEPGAIEYVCSLCGEKKTEAVPMIRPSPSTSPAFKLVPPTSIPR